MYSVFIITYSSLLNIFLVGQNFHLGTDKKQSCPLNGFMHLMI